MSELPLNLNIDTLTVPEFKEYLPELTAAGGGKISEDARFAKFFAEHPECIDLVRDLEAIADAARSLFDTPAHEPADSVWSNIASKLKQGVTDEESGTPEPEAS
ncbi:MAG: hypothetical protein V4555_11470 [Acidobacteriota bacterium]